MTGKGARKLATAREVAILASGRPAEMMAREAFVRGYAAALNDVEATCKRRFEAELEKLVSEMKTLTRRRFNVLFRRLLRDLRKEGRVSLERPA